MPTVLRHGPYRFFFYASDRGEPPHIHVERDDDKAKFWLGTLMLERSKGFRRKELNRIRQLIKANRTEPLRGWDEYFNE